jgi:hypothetical protein
MVAMLIFFIGIIASKAPREAEDQESTLQEAARD